MLHFSSKFVRGSTQLAMSARVPCAMTVKVSAPCVRALLSYASAAMHSRVDVLIEPLGCHCLYHLHMNRKHALSIESPCGHRESLLLAPMRAHLLQSASACVMASRLAALNVASSANNLRKARKGRKILDSHARGERGLR